tara:strand:+ start:13331 stop:13789 length:459 start_codon:yes stop_codon:yes gene_type:complete
MAEITSRQAAAIASRGKMSPSSAGVMRVSVIRSPATVTWAQNDTCGNRDRIPAGSRILGSFISSAAAGASVTLSVGLRAWTADGSGTVVDAAAINNAVAASSAINGFNAGGVLVTSGAEYVTTQDTEPFFTLGGATPTANAQVVVTVVYIAP